MINLRNIKNSEGYGLSLQDGVLRVNQSVSEIIFVEDSIKIEVAEGVSACFLEKAVAKEIILTIENLANVEYQMINSQNCKRVFNNFGKLEIMGICLEATQEELMVYELSENASVDIQKLAIGNQFSMHFKQDVIHNAPKTYSNISNYGVAIESADIVFDTTGSISSGMAKSVCKQLSKGILMDDASSITSKPNLLIDEFDVIANHGASIGKMSDESLFYLMSRGLSRYEAFLLILEGIIRPFIEKIKVEELKQEIDKKLKSLIKR